MHRQRLIRRVVFAFVFVAMFIATILLFGLVLVKHSIDKMSLHSRIALSSSDSKFELRYPDCQTAPPELWANTPSTNHVWQKVQSVELTIFHNCVARPVRLYVSKDQKLLFVRRTADREFVTGLAPTARKSSWSDLIDISKTAPQVILSLGGCCMDEDYNLETEINLDIEKIARTKGIELLPY